MTDDSTNTVLIRWLGHAAFMISMNGFVILIDPWLGNPKAPANAKDIDHVDAIFVTHGHFDHIGDTIELAKKHNLKVFCQHEIGIYLQGHGVPEDRVVTFNHGGTIDIGGGCKATMVPAVHSGACGMKHPMEIGGTPAGFVIIMPNGHRIYHTGDTDVYGDMKIVSDLHKPDVALMCIGDHYTMGPKGAAYALDNLLASVEIVVPMHYGTFPLLHGTPAELQTALKRKDVNVCKLNPGEEMSLKGRAVGKLLSDL